MLAYSTALHDLKCPSLFIPWFQVIANFNKSVQQQCASHTGASKTQITGSLLGAYTQANDTATLKKGANVLLCKHKHGHKKPLLAEVAGR